MNRGLKRIVQAAGAAALLLVAAGLAAPYFQAGRFGARIKVSLQSALGREVEIKGPVHFSLFRGPGFSLEKVVIHEDPAVGIEPVAYVESLTAAPRIWPLLAGRIEIASVRLSDCDINLAKTGAPSEPGRWNFQPLVSRPVMAAFPGIHVRNGRINFRFGDTKSVFYLMNTDLDISPPAHGSAWRFSFSGAPGRTDRPARGLGAFTADGRWTAAQANTPDRLDMDLVLERTGFGEILALLHGQAGGIHGTVSSRMHLAGRLSDIGINGALRIEDVHRWDMLPPKDGGWPLYVSGKLNLAAQRLELETSSTEKAPLPLSVRFLISDYLAQPHWSLAVSWNRFQLQPLLELARHMGIVLPPRLQIAGTMDGALKYSDQASFQGGIVFRDTALAIPDSPPVRFDQAQMMFDGGHVHLAPAVARTGEDEAGLEADYAWGDDIFDLTISTESMKISSLRAQVALAAVPWLEQVQSGEWSGTLRYHRAANDPGIWRGQLEVTDAVLATPGLAHPLTLATARARIDGARVALDRMRASAGALTFTGDYRYEPPLAHPHRVHLVFGELDASEVERELGPTLQRGGSFFARALGRTPLPDWLRQRSAEGTFEAASVLLGGVRIENVRGHLVWDQARAELNNLRAVLEKGQLTGKLVANLRGSRPSYRLNAALKGMSWQTGKLDAEGVINAGGTGRQLLANLTAEGTFAGKALDFGLPSICKTVQGTYAVIGTRTTPRLRFTDIEIATADETYTGHAATADDGRMIVFLSDGTREMRMSGTLAKLKPDEPVRP